MGERAARGTSSAIPAQTTSFVGRSRELAELEAAFASARLVTITGAGGSGKTRLALEFIARSPTLPSTVVVDLAPVTDPALVTAVLGSALGVRERAGDDPIEALAERLADDEAVVVLDNLEHLAGVGSIVADLLARAPGVRILGTSRAPLHIRGEHEYPLSPLDLADPAAAGSVEELGGVEAVRLFVDRAGAVRPGFELTTENASTVAEICARLDGLPLAIELAAARLRMFTPDALLGRLDRVLPVLTGGPVDAPARQRTLLATIDWSYALLDEEDQVVLGALAVFAGPFTLEAAAAIVGSPADILATIERLVDQSVVGAAATPDDEARFRLLETIREFAWGLVDEASRDVVRDRHLAYFVSRAAGAEDPLRGPEQARWILRLATEQADIRGALVWAERAHRAESLVRLASSLRRRFWYEAGGLREGRRWLDAAIAVGSEVPAGLRARALQRTAWVVLEMGGDIERAEALFEASLEDADDDDHVTQLEALIGLTYLAMGTGGAQLDVAALRLDQAFEAARRAGTPGILVEPLTAEGRLAEARGDWDRAAAAYEEALEMAREAGDVWGASYAGLSLGLIALAEGDHVRAQPSLQGAVVDAIESGDREVHSHALAALARSLVATDQLAVARSRLREGAEVAREILNPMGDILLVEAAAAWLGSAGSWPAAVEAWASADGERSGIPWSSRPQEIAARRSMQDAARRVLGGVRYELAWSAGAARDIRVALDVAVAAVEATDLDALAMAPTMSPRSGRFDLTPREQEVLALVAEGMTDGEIAASLVISKKTASVHVAHIKSKLGASSRVEIATMALRGHPR